MYEELNRETGVQIYGRASHNLPREKTLEKHLFILILSISIIIVRKKGERCHCEASDSDDFPPSKNGEMCFLFYMIWSIFINLQQQLLDDMNRSVTHTSRISGEPELFAVRCNWRV